jgi:hypothetical protein
MGGAGRAQRVLAGALLAALAPVLLGVQVYHSEEEALHLAFPDATSFEEEVHLVDEAARRRVTERAGAPGRERVVTLHVARREGRIVGRALVLKEIGKSLPFRFLVAIRPDGAVEQVLLLDYREPRGDEVRRGVFRRQYVGKRLDDPIRRGRDIRNISGATISVDSLSRGVRRALALHEELVGAPAAARHGGRPDRPEG